MVAGRIRRIVFIRIPFFWRFSGYNKQVYNPDFNYGEFAIIKSQSGLNSFKISVKEFVERTNAISLQAKAGRYGGTYAHKDIAFEFAMWINLSKVSLSYLTNHFSFASSFP